MTEPQSQPAPQSFWHRLLDAKLSRREAIGRAAAVSAASVVLPVTIGTAGAQALPNNGAPVDAASTAERVSPLSYPPFSPIGPTMADDVTLPRGYTYQILAPWGEPLNAAGDRIGFNHDFVGYFPVDALEGGASSSDALLTINHEYVNPLFVGGSRERTPAQIREEMQSVGVSVVRVRREGGRWATVRDPRNRMISALSPAELTGPVAGHAVVGGAVQVRGTVGNCSGGQTPWGTLLTCEENVDGYARAWPDSGYERMHQGWVTEIDPFDPDWTPKKRTAMGRFRHENVAPALLPDGRFVGYMGDDAQDSCIYKFVSKGRFDPQDRAVNLRLLETGELYVANLGRGRWELLDYDRNPALQNAKRPDGTALFANQAEVLADARAAALAIGGTPTDRPEDIEIHPKTGEVYVALTNNSRHGNYFGQIIKITEAENSWDAEHFLWDVFAYGGPSSGFASPDNLVFDPYGNLWMVTDNSDLGTNPIKDFHGNNAMFFFPTEGPNAGKAYRFAVGPVDAEMTGPVWSPDGRTLFLAIQHPGEDSESLDALTSHFAAAPGSDVPRPTLVAISGFPGWRKA